MPRMTLEPQNKAKNSYEFPKLYLERGERARIAMIEVEPHWEWVHTLKAPQIVNGKPVYETVLDNKTKESRQVMKMDFIGRHICVGDPEVMAKKNGVDPEGCPVCKESQSSDAVKPPERRFAVNVLSYQLKHGSFAVQEPFQVESLVWSFSDFQLNKLIDFAQEWQSSGGLQQHDLLLGPCESKQFQKFDINVAPDAQWLTTDERKKLATAVYKNNRLEDLSVAIGRRLDVSQVKDDLDRVMSRYNTAHGLDKPSSQEEVSDASELDSAMDVAGLLGGSPDVEKPKAKQPVKGEDNILNLDDLMNL